MLSEIKTIKSSDRRLLFIYKINVHCSPMKGNEFDEILFQIKMKSRYIFDVDSNCYILIRPKEKFYNIICQKLGVKKRYVNFHTENVDCKVGDYNIDKLITKVDINDNEYYRDIRINKILT